MPSSGNCDATSLPVTTLQMCRRERPRIVTADPETPGDRGRTDEMNPKMTEFLAQDRIAGMRSEAARNQLAKRGPDATPAIEERPRHLPTIPVVRVGRWLRRSITV